MRYGFQISLLLAIFNTQKASQKNIFGYLLQRPDWFLKHCLNAYRAYVTYGYCLSIQHIQEDLFPSTAKWKPPSWFWAVTVLSFQVHQHDNMFPFNVVVPLSMPLATLPVYRWCHQFCCWRMSSLCIYSLFCHLRDMNDCLLWLHWWNVPDHDVLVSQNTRWCFQSPFCPF